MSVLCAATLHLWPSPGETSGPTVDGAMPVLPVFRASGLVAAFLAIALPAVAAADSPGVIVRYRAGTTATERLTARDDAHVTRQDALPLARTEVDHPGASTSVAEAVRALNGDPAVDYAEPNRRVHTLLTPNDNLFANEWGLQNSAQSITNAAALPSPLAGADIHATAAWDLTTG